MEKYQNLILYTAGTKCSVEGCVNQAKYEVALYDYYPTTNQHFFEQDRTCPFICEMHHDLNEAGAIGEKKPRRVVKYPFTNQYRAQGYTKYLLIENITDE